ncbi:MAG: VIT1/CCC1 transporter family protein [Acidimicrobiales bacterium]
MEGAHDARPATADSTPGAAKPVAGAAGQRVSRRRRHRLVSEIQAHDHHHRNLQGGGARAAVFGVSDGLVTNVSLVLGIAGAHPAVGLVRLAGLAGLIGGAFSMSAGEYVSMRAQRELLERELDLERHEITHRPEGERRELVRIYENRGVEPEVARRLAGEMMRTPELALETHAREELGITPGALGSPVQAALSSFSTFAIGALIPLLPWLITSGTAAILASVIVTGVAALVVGGALSLFTGKSWWWSALRQLAISAVAAAITYSIGRLVGANGL